MSDDEKISFKSIKRKNIRQRKKSASSDEEDGKIKNEDIKEKLEIIQETKEKQKLRIRNSGVNM